MKNLLKTLSASLGLLLMCQSSIAQSIDLQWIDGAPEIPAGVSWGLPFEKGKIKKDQQFILTAGDNKIPVQSWVMASHADGSVKWMGFSAAIESQQTTGLKVTPVKTKEATQGIKAEEYTNEIIVNNGIGEFVFSKTGSNLIKSIKSGSTLIVENGQLACILENRINEQNNILQYDNFVGNIEKVTLEQSGPVRAVVKFEGKHKAIKGSREWLPFVVRFYIYNNLESIKMVHTIIFDGDQSSDFIKGLGVVFDLPLREEMHNRHVRFSGDGNGLWSEPIQPLSGRRRISYPEGYTGSIYNDQIAGKRMPARSEFNQQGQFLLDNWAVWNDFKLTQLSPDAFTVRKRTNNQSTWIGTAGDKRSSGLVLAGDVSGGLAVSLKNFWQSYPVELEAVDMRNDKAQLKIWMWSPQSNAMDLRHYDVVGHGLEAAYEDFQEGMSTPYGVARTSELTLYPFSSLPTKEETVKMAQTAQKTVQLMATPQYLYDTKAFGIWSLPDKSNESKKWIEDQIDGYIHFYEKAIEDHKWYGFWNFGDVMHSYNAGRHMWNYDIGGNAWANTELSPGIWLWLAFIRTGRSDIFTLAQNMTRHTGEVDMYHIGDMAGLGTRHNVSHWGCGAKEARIGQAWWKRYSYYLTTDERMGDLMHEVVDADYKMLEYDPLRVAQPRTQFPTNQPTRLRWGPDWTAFVGNWFTEWERTSDKKYLEKIKTGMSSLAAMPNGLFTGKGPLGYDPETGRLTYEGEPDWIDNRNHLANLMGSFEVLMEVYDAIGHKEFNKAYLMYTKFYGLPQNHPIRELKENKKYKNWWGHWSTPRLGAFASRELNDPQLAELAWKDFFSSAVDFDGKLREVTNITEIETPDVLYPVSENVSISTNSTAQWNINAIIMLELIGDKIPPLEQVINDVAREREISNQ